MFSQLGVGFVASLENAMYIWTAGDVFLWDKCGLYHPLWRWAFFVQGCDRRCSCFSVDIPSSFSLIGKLLQFVVETGKHLVFCCPFVFCFCLPDQAALDFLTSLGPSATDTEFRLLDMADAPGDYRLMFAMFEFFFSLLQSRQSFELVQAYLALFLKVNYLAAFLLWIIAHVFYNWLFSLGLWVSVSRWPGLCFQDCTWLLQMKLWKFTHNFWDLCVHAFEEHDCLQVHLW